MALATPQPRTSSSIPPYPVRRFTVQEYHRLAESGVLSEGEPIELLGGWLIPMMTRGPKHDAVLHELLGLLWTVMPEGWIIRIQSALTLEDSEPEPDLAIVRGPHARYVRRHPGADEVALVIEIADASLKRDQELKGRLYATAAIPQYWLVDLQGRVVDIYSDPDPADPSSAGYRRHFQIQHHQSIPLIVDNSEVARIQAKTLLPE